MQGRVLGIDLGLKRTGLALSDELRLSVRALDNITPQSRAADVATLVALIREHEVVDVVIGLASLGSGDDSMMARRARGFKDALDAGLQAAGVSAQVHLVDEAHSSRQAAERLVASQVKRHQRKALLDGEAARGLVLAFIDGG